MMAAMNPEAIRAAQAAMAKMSPEQIVHGVAQLLGLWPPGYIVDPCELGRQDMDYFQNAVEEADRDMLRAAVLQVSARCR